MRRLTTLLSVDARICARPDRLCLQIQDCVLWYHEDLDLVQKRLECFWICHHLKDDLPLLIDRWAIPGADGPKTPQVEVRQCVHCKLDCQSEIGEFDSTGVLIVVTKWLDLRSAAGLVRYSTFHRNLPFETMRFRVREPLIEACGRQNLSRSQVDDISLSKLSISLTEDDNIDKPQLSCSLPHSITELDFQKFISEFA